MGYACPVCDVPQADAKHLANHLAFTALIHDGDEHEAWLDEHVPGWSERGEQELAEAVTELTEDAEYPQVFEDTTHGDGEHRHDDERSGKLFEDDGPVHPEPTQRGQDKGSLDPEARAIVEEAQKLTERRRRNRDGDDDAEADDGAQ